MFSKLETIIAVAAFGLIFVQALHRTLLFFEQGVGCVDLSYVQSPEADASEDHLPFHHYRCKKI